MSSPNMALPIPSVAVTAGPTWANNINTCLTLIDAHDHSPGYGVAITPAGLNINANLTLNSHQLTNIGALVFTSESAVATLQSAYVLSADLYFRDGNNNEVRITQGGSIAGTPGSISGLVSPASASYSASTFTFQSNVNTAANIDVASVKLRNTSVSSYALTLNPPSGMGANIAQTLPTIPAATKLMSMDTSGNMYAQTVADESTLTWNSNTTLKVKDGGITSTQLNASVLALFPNAKAQTYTTTGSNTFAVPAGVNWVYVIIQAAGGGAGGSSGSGATGSGGSGGGAGEYWEGIIPVTPSTNVTVTVGAKGTGGAGVSNGTASNGTDGGSSSIAGAFTITCSGGNKGIGGINLNTSVANSGGAAVTAGGPLVFTNTGGGNGGQGSAGSGGGATAGGSSRLYSGGSAGTGSFGAGGGGGGTWFGGGGNGANQNGAAVGVAGTSAAAGAYGAGGGGASSGGASLTGANGGDGMDGIVTLYYVSA